MFSPHSPSPDRRSQSLRSRPSSSDPSALGSGSSSLSESDLDDESGTGSPGSGSGSPERSCSASPDVVFLGESEEGPADAEEEENGSDDEETLSLLDISDNEEACKAAVCEKACQSDVLYAAWQDKQIHQGNDDIAKCDKRECDHADIGKRCKAPDEIGPLLTYMEERGVFKPAEAINNPMGLCRFYQMSTKKSNVLTGPKSTDCAHKIQGMVELAKGVGRPLTVVVFEGESVTPMCLLQELRSCLTLSHIAIHTLEEVKVGPMNHMSCCPICAYVVKNDHLFLNHIIIGHYWSSFSCGKYLKFMATDGQQMKRHIPGCGKPQKEHKKKHSTNNKAPEVCSSSKSGHKSKKAKKKKKDKEGIGVVGQKKPRSSPTKSSTAATSQEQAPHTPRHGTCKATSGCPRSARS